MSDPQKIKVREYAPECFGRRAAQIKVKHLAASRYDIAHDNDNLTTRQYCDNQNIARYNLQRVF